MKRNLTTAFASIAGTKVIVTLIGAVTTPILFRLLGAGGYGEYATTMAVFGLLMILASSGITSGARKYLAEERDDPDWKDNVFGYYFRLAAVLALAASIFLVVAAESGLVTATISDRFVPYFYLLAVLAVTAQFRSYVRQALMGLQLEHISEPIKVLRWFVYSAVGIGLAYLGYGVSGVLIGHIAASLTVIVVSGFFIVRHISLRSIITPTPSSFPRKELFNFNHLSILYLFLIASLYHVDVLMLELFTDSDQVGYYRAALVLVQFLWFVPRSVQATMIQSTSNLWAQQDIGRITRISSHVTRYTLLLTLLMALGLAALASEVVPIYYGPDATPVILPVLLLLPGTLGFAIARPILAISHAKGDMKAIILATGAAATLNFVLNLVLIPLYGIAGAAIATTIGYGSLPIFHIYAARNHLGYDPLWDVRFRRVGITAILSGVVIGGLAFVIGNPWVALIVVPPVGLLAFTLFAFATRALALEEIFDILKALPPPIDSKAAAIQRRVDDISS